MGRHLFILWALVLGDLKGANPVRVLLDENRLEEGLEICRQFEVLAGYDQEVLLSCSWIYYRLDKPQSAEVLMGRVKRASSLPEVQILSAFGAIRANKFDEALSTIESVEKGNRDTPIGLSAQEVKAELFEARGQLDTAAFLYKQVLSVNKRRGRAHWGLGRYYLSKGDSRRAVEHLSETARLWPKHLGSRFNLGVMYLNQNELIAAATWLSQCYNLNRADVGVLEQLGNLFEKKGKLKEALKHWQKAIDLGAISPVPREKTNQYLALTIEGLLADKKFTEALLKMESLPAELKGQPKLSLLRGIAYRNLGNYKKASGELLVFLQKEPENPTGLRELGICYVNLDLPSQAFAAFEKAIQKDVNDGYNHAWFAYLLESKGEYVRAREHWNQAITKLKDPSELERAVRRVTAIEKKLREK